MKMKVVSKIISIIILACVGAGWASAEEKVSRAQVDTIVARVFRQFTLPLYNSVQKDKSECDKLIREFLAFERTSNAVYFDMKELPASELKDELYFTGSYVFFRLNTKEFWDTYKTNILKAEWDEEFDYEIRDKEYAALAGRLEKDYIDLMKYADEQALIPLNHKGIYKPKVLRISKDKLPVLLAKTLLEYFPYEEFINAHPECWGIRKAVSARAQEPLKLLIGTSYTKAMGEAVLGNTDKLAYLSEYMKLSRGPLYVSNHLYRPTREVVLKKGLYKGETYDGIPDGEGVLIDKKGIEYSGTFRNGLRHGPIHVYNPKKGADTLKQWWYKDKFRKDLPTDSWVNGIQVVPEVKVMDGQRFGYGCYFDGRTFEGDFVDSKLVGIGSIETPKSKTVGYFNGNLTKNCTIVWKDTEKNKDAKFVGTEQGNFRSGIFSRVEKKGNRLRVWDGDFINGAPDGQIAYSNISRNDSTWINGLYAYGNLYGHGRVEHNRVYKNGMKERVTYEGTVIMNKAHGKGSADIILTSFPQEKFNIDRYGLNLSDQETQGKDTVTVQIRGTFKDGVISEGKVAISNGCFMIGRFSDGVLSDGRLVKRLADGSVYDGKCRNGKYHGYVRITHADGSMNEGLFENGLPVGIKAEYTADWDLTKLYLERRSFRFDDLIDKKGIVNVVRAAGVKLMVRGSSTVEVTCQGKFEGEDLVAGKISVSDGTWLEGIFEDGVLVSGKGKTIDKYSTVYIGDIKNGVPHGKGVCHYNDGTTFKGNFANGNRRDGTHYSSKGKIIKVYQ